MVQARKEAPAETLPGIRSAWAKKSDVRLEGLFFPKGPCSQIVYTLALKHSLYRYIGPKVHTIGFVTDYEHYCAAGAGAPADRNP